jgi:uncharacterized protein YutE (UPF0331/DUF86 family)
MAYVVQFDVTPEEAETVLGDNLHVISLNSSTSVTRDEVLATFFQSVQESLDTKAGVSFRSSRPDIFEEVKADLIQRAVESPDQSAIIEATSRLCFVLMPSGKRFDNLYRGIIAPAVAAQGFTALRADELAGPSFIMEQIRSAIQQARFCMADLTSSNPNVLYEVGLAHAASKPMILIAEQGSKLPFDLAHQRIIFYGSPIQEDQTIRDVLWNAINLLASQERMPEAARLLDMGLYRASIASSAIVLEQRLNAMLLHRRPGIFMPGSSLKQMFEALKRLNAITTQQVSKLSEVVALRNRAIHDPKEPSKKEAEVVLTTVRSFLEEATAHDPAPKSKEST